MLSWVWEAVPHGFFFSDANLFSAKLEAKQGSADPYSICHRISSLAYTNYCLYKQKYKVVFSDGSVHRGNQSQFAFRRGFQLAVSFWELPSVGFVPAFPMHLVFMELFVVAHFSPRISLQRQFILRLGWTALFLPKGWEKSWDSLGTAEKTASWQ